MANRTLCIDWDDTLVDAKTQEWLPGAAEAFRLLLTQWRTVIVHTCRANWPEGVAQIEAKIEADIAGKPWQTHIAPAGRIQIVGKPSAEAYIDNLAVRFTGDWQKTLGELPPPPAVRPRKSVVVRGPARIAPRPSFRRVR